MESKIYGIKEITQYIESVLAQDDILNDLWLTGEISNFYHHDSGHMYFTLKDESASIKSIMFNSNNKNLKFELEDGLKVTAHGYIGIYVPRGIYQFYVDKIQPEGKGALFLAYKQLKDRLEKEGLFKDEIKKTIPLLPSKIGIVTSPDGAAIRDILSVVNRRFENVSVLIVPSLVQGDQAADQIVQGIEYLNNRNDIDLIIVSRGGGSLEDLWPFNEEKVARAIHNSMIPVISGVGHETDFTIADFTADLRAPTPSAAAELAIASRIELEKNLNTLKERLINSIINKMETNREKIKSLATKRVFTNPQDLFSDQVQSLDELTQKLHWNMEKILKNCQEKYKILSGKLDTLSPLKTLERGYSITSDSEKRIIDSIEEVATEEEIITRLVDGKIKSEIKKIQKDGELYESK
ncbi:MAG: exodeoxyribonuclease VII large subunit [Bacillota bacterium]